MIDVYQLTGAGECPSQLSSRIIVVPWQHQDLPPGWLGLLAAHVSEIRQIQISARCQTAWRCQVNPT